MAVQIINEPTLGNLLGQQLAQGLGGGLQQLASSKLNQVLQQGQQLKTASGLQALGYTPQESVMLSQLDPVSLGNIIKDRSRAMNQADISSPGLRALIPGLSEQESREIGKLTPGIQLEFYRNFLQNPELAGQIQQSQQQAPAQFPQQEVNQLVSPINKRSSIPFPEPPKLQPVLSKEERIAQHEADKQAKPLSTAERIAAAKVERLRKQEAKEAEKAERIERASRFKETYEDRKNIINKSRVAKERLEDLERIEDLEKEGKLDTPGYVEFLKRSGLDIPALLEPGSEEFNKISANFIRGAKDVFGSRISNYEIEQFLKTLPNLSMSPEGRKRVIANLKRVSRADLEYNNTLKEVMRENKGIPPYDLLEQVEERVGSKLDALSRRFKEDLKKEVPAGQNKFITALQAGAGSLAGAIPSALKGAGKGALVGAGIGKFGGGGGALAGAGVGALGGLLGLI